MTTDKLKYFPKELKGKFVGAGQWELTAPFEYHSDIGSIIEIPIGFVTDGASIPKIFRPVIGSPWGGLYVKATLPHDWLYYKKTFTRRKTDAIFLEAMKVLGVPFWKRRIMWLAVRLGAWISWDKRKPLIPAAGIILLLLFSGCAGPKDYTFERVGDKITVSGKKIWFGLLEEDGIGNVEIEAEMTKDTCKIKINNKNELLSKWPEFIYKD